MITPTTIVIIPRTVMTNDYGETIPTSSTPINVQGIISAPTVTESGDTVAPDGTQCNAVLYVTRDSMPDSLTERDALRHAQVRVGRRLFDVVGSPALDVPYALHPTEFYETGIPLREVSGE